MCDCKGYTQNRVLDATDGILGAFLNQDDRTWMVPNQKTPKIWQGDRNSWECSLRFIGWGIGTHGNAV